MSLKDLNLNKLIGREAVAQGSWSVKTSDGQACDVWVGLKSGLIGARLIVKVDDKPFLEKRKQIIAGQLMEFEFGGDIFAVRHSGLGLFGRLGLVQNGRDLSDSATAFKSDPGPAPEDGRGDADTWETWIEEAERFSEPLGDEIRVIDNARSNSSTERRITVSRQWSQSVSLDIEKAVQLDGSLDAKLPLSLGFSLSATGSIKRKYAVSEDVTRTYSEEVTINVLPMTRSTITFSWRQVWQKGMVVGRNAQGLEVRVPFEVKLHPTFDQSQEDVKSGGTPDGA